VLNVATVVRYQGVADQVASLRGSVESLSREPVAGIPSPISGRVPPLAIANNLDADAVARNIANQLKPEMRNWLEQQKKSDREEIGRIAATAVGARVASLRDATLFSPVRAAVPQNNSALREILRKRDGEYDFVPSWNAGNPSLNWTGHYNRAVLAIPHSLYPDVQMQVPSASPAIAWPGSKP
jgi:hypothetical protein